MELDLQGNNFGERISPKAFVGVGERLLALNLAWSNVTRLSGKVFRGLKAVRNMSLAENHLRRLPSAIFDDLRNVERLKLAGNSELGELPRRLFRNQQASLQVDNRLAILYTYFCARHKPLNYNCTRNCIHISPFCSETIGHI